MELPAKSTSNQKKTLITDTWWNTFNGKNEQAEPEKVRLERVESLPGALAVAVATAPKNNGGLDPQRVNWRVTCLSTNGRDVLKRPADFEGAEMSGRTCGENGMWATPKDVNKRNEAVPGASAFFDRTGCIYIIDAGLCPCKRCCQSLIGLAAFTNSTLIVRPTTDYEIIASSRTVLASTALYLLVFSPTDGDTFKLYNNVFAEPGRARYACTGEPQHQFTVLFPDRATLGQAITRSRMMGFGSSVEYPVFKCPRCKPTKDDPAQKLYFDDKSPALPPESLELASLKPWQAKGQ